jgi:hypothetical protein
VDGIGEVVDVVRRDARHGNPAVKCHMDCEVRMALEAGTNQDSI